MSNDLKCLNDSSLPVADPAVMAIAVFEKVRERFEAVLTAKDRAESSLLASAVEPGSPEYEQTRGTLGLSDLEEKEDVLGREHDAALATAFATVPLTTEGMRSLAALIRHQQRQGAPEAMLAMGADSLVCVIGGIREP